MPHSRGQSIPSSKVLRTHGGDYAYEYCPDIVPTWYLQYERRLQVAIVTVTGTYCRPNYRNMKGLTKYTFSFFTRHQYRRMCAFLLSRLPTPVTIQPVYTTLFGHFWCTSLVFLLLLLLLLLLEVTITDWFNFVWNEWTPIPMYGSSYRATAAGVTLSSTLHIICWGK